MTKSDISHNNNNDSCLHNTQINRDLNTSHSNKATTFIMSKNTKSSNYKSPDPDYVFRGFESAVTCCDFSLDGEHLIIGNLNGYLSIWSLKTMRKIIDTEIQAHPSTILFLKMIEILNISSSSNTNVSNEQAKKNSDDLDTAKSRKYKNESETTSVILTQGRNDSIKIWEADALLSIECSGEIIHDKENVANREKEDVLLLWEIVEDSGTLNFCKASIMNSNGTHNSLSDVLAYPMGSQGHKVAIYSLSEKKVLNEVGDKETGMVMCIQLTNSTESNSILLIGGYENGKVYVWNALNGSKFKCISCFEDPVMSLSLFHHWVVIVGSQNDVWYWDISEKYDSKSSTNSLFKEQENPEKSSCVKLHFKSTGYGCVSWRLDGKLLAFGAWNGQIEIYTKKLKRLGALVLHKDSITDICFSSTNRMAVTSRDKRVSLWSIYA